jgi:hypothetical protein
MMEKKARNDENIKQVKELLYAANYRCGHNMHGTNGDIEFFVGGGPIPVIALQYYNNDDGFELWVPISQSNRMDDTLAALRKATQKEVSNG